MRKIFGIILCCLGPLSLVVMSVEKGLLGTGVLNTKDLPPFIGNEIGTFSEYLFNVWHWDAAGFLLMLLALPGLYVGLRLLLTDKDQAADNARHG
ncbi:MAG: hypothetical protein WEB58_12260 [Planctomycetaceae bacterium]